MKKFITETLSDMFIITFLFVVIGGVSIGAVKAYKYFEITQSNDTLLLKEFNSCVEKLQKHEEIEKTKPSEQALQDCIEKIGAYGEKVYY